MSPLRRVAAALLFASCATPYAYRFERAEAPAEAGVELNASLDPTGARAVLLEVHNLTAEPLQVAWPRIAMLAPDGNKTLLAPEHDLGWVAPGATVTAHLGSFVLPGAGNPARALEGRRFVLEIPMTVLDEPRTLRCPFIAHVEPL